MYGSILRYFKTQKRFNAATNGAAEKLPVYQGQFIGREHDGRGDAGRKPCFPHSLCRNERHRTAR